MCLCSAPRRHCVRSIDELHRSKDLDGQSASRHDQPRPLPRLAWWQNGALAPPPPRHGSHGGYGLLAESYRSCGASVRRLARDTGGSPTAGCESVVRFPSQRSGSCNLVLLLPRAHRGLVPLLDATRRSLPHCKSVRRRFRYSIDTLILAQGVRLHAVSGRLSPQRAVLPRPLPLQARTSVISLDAFPAWALPALGIRRIRQGSAISGASCSGGLLAFYARYDDETPNLAERNDWLFPIFFLAAIAGAMLAGFYLLVPQYDEILSPIELLNLTFAGIRI